MKETETLITQTDHGINKERKFDVDELIKGENKQKYMQNLRKRKCLNKEIKEKRKLRIVIFQ